MQALFDLCKLESCCCFKARPELAHEHEAVRGSPESSQECFWYALRHSEERLVAAMADGVKLDAELFCTRLKKFYDAWQVPGLPCSTALTMQGTACLPPGSAPCSQNLPRCI